MKNYIFLLFFLISACTKEVEELRIVELLAEGHGTYLLTYGTSSSVTVKGEDTWSTSIEANPGDTIKFSVTAAQNAVTLYMRITVEDGLLYCKSLYVETGSVGSLNHILTP